MKQLTVTDGSTPGKDVFAAMIAAMKFPCNRGPMISYVPHDSWRTEHG